jgi:hypothetical protein
MDCGTKVYGFSRVFVITPPKAYANWPSSAANGKPIEIDIFNRNRQEKRDISTTKNCQWPSGSKREKNNAKRLFQR